MTFAREGRGYRADRRALRQQFAMYIAALRISDDFGLDVSASSTTGLEDLVAASDITKGSTPRPSAVRSRDGSRVLWSNQALPTSTKWTKESPSTPVTKRSGPDGLDPSTTLHDVRWGKDFDGQFVWVFEISGSVPASTSPTATPAPPACVSPRCISRWRRHPARTPAR